MNTGLPLTCNKTLQDGPIEPEMVSYERYAFPPIGNDQYPSFDVKKSIIKKFFLAHQEKFGKYDLQNGFGKYYLSSIGS